METECRLAVVNRTETRRRCLPIVKKECGAGEGNRTPDLFITSESLCRLSYPGDGMTPDLTCWFHRARRCPQHSAPTAITFAAWQAMQRVESLTDLSRLTEAKRASQSTTG
jgi:hypothetical protein